jgi:glycosyltransferase involved in cell wall biosynthesis
MGGNAAYKSGREGEVVLIEEEDNTGENGERHWDADEEEEELLEDEEEGSAIVPGKEPLLCIVITSYNLAGFIDQSIQAVTSQTYKALEVVVVDDASNDGTQSKIDVWARKDERIKVLKMPFNALGGAGQAMNRGLAMCTGKYVAIVDGDDFMHIQMYEKMVSKMESMKLDMVVCNYNTIDSSLKLEEAVLDQDFWVRLVGGPNRAKHALKAQKDPDLLRLSSPPWRKVYLRTFLSTAGAHFPEGDYFNEDFYFHWAVTMAAKRVGVVDEVLYFHRKSREGQKSYDPKPLVKGQELLGVDVRDENLGLTGVLMNINRIGKLLFSGSSKKKDAMFLAEFFAWLVRTRWILLFPRTDKTRRKVEAMWYRTVQRWYIRSPRWYRSNKASKVLKSTLTKYKSRISDVHVSIVIPCYNSKKNVLLLLEDLTQKNIWVREGHNTHFGKFEVILVDDKSTDGLYEAVKEYRDNCDNFYYVYHDGPPGAGRARNMAIPLVEGKYVYFLDADDTFDVKALAGAYTAAAKQEVDLIMLPYNLSMSGNLKPMFNADETLWLKGYNARRSAMDNKSVTQVLKETAFALINYPWNRMLRTEVILAGDIFFGGTIVHNDVQYHWDSITQASSVLFYHQPVCLHRKDPKMKQITNIATNDRATVVDSILFTDRILQRKGFYKKPTQVALWFKFVKHIFSWAKDKVPDDIVNDYERRSQAVLAQLTKRSPTALAMLNRETKRRNHNE